MNTNPDVVQFIDILRSAKGLSAADLPLVDRLLQAYPSFSLPAALMLKVPELTADVVARLKATVALNAPDIDSLALLIDPDGRRFASFYPAEPAPETPSTDDALSTFLDTYGSGADDIHQQQLLERLIFNPVPADYSQVLAAQQADEPQPEQPVSEQDALLDAFLAHQSSVADTQQHDVLESPKPAHQPHIKPDADAPLSESLAKIYIKQQRFDKAYEIILQLSLNFPKKSVYFADQLRFLQKLMLNQRRQQAKRNK